MSEIKHNFMKGKMNKDLDERLVPNGEYRDALNIQVTTSEGSDVGTVQNILGNSLIAGQDFIAENAVCVGSIADEKNDKLYYFITQKQLLSNGEFNNGGDGWNISGGAYTGNQWSFVNNQAVGTDTDDGTMWADAVGVETGGTYRITYDVVVPSGGSLILANHGVGGGGNIALINESTIGTYHVEWTQGASSSRQNRIWIYNSVTYDGTIDNVTVFDAKAHSLIVEYDSKTNSITPVFVDMLGDVLKFDENNIITGINIIDDLLLWTDNSTEPKKINITRCKLGTDLGGLIHTNLFVDGSILLDGLGNAVKAQESHITAIKKSPYKAPRIIKKLNLNDAQGNLTQHNYFYPSGANAAGIANQQVDDGHEMWIGIDDATELSVGSVLRIYREWNADLDGAVVARLLIKEIVLPGLEFTFPQIQNNFDASGVISTAAQYSLKVSVSTLAKHDSTNEYTWKLEQEGLGIFERKLPRFACRYKYEDNEYSSVGPFSEVVFIPGAFDYEPIKAYNKGMINNLKELTLAGFVPQSIPVDVVQVDLLYKNEFSPNIFVVKTIDKNDAEWFAGDGGEYAITTENIYAQIPSNQLIRPWDNLPRKALAQEVTGNRVVYANYVQNYDLIDAQGNKIVPSMEAGLNERFGNDSYGDGVKSIKSQRTYNFGIVYGDEYGRETPVFTSDEANQLITKSSSASSNAISIDINNEHPSWAEYYKIFVKETSNEYYNLAMGRVYDAKDGNVWLSFPSIDRNKIDEDTYLILKKGAGGEGSGDYVGFGGVVLDDARYKVVAIENEAPDYIKTTWELLAEPAFKRLGASAMFGGSAYLVEYPGILPHPGNQSFTIRKSHWVGDDPASSYKLKLPDLVKLWTDKGSSDIYVSFSQAIKVDGIFWDDSEQRMSRKYKVSDVELLPSAITNTAAFPGWKDEDVFKVHLTEPILSTDGWIARDAATGSAGISGTNKGGRMRPHFYKEIVENKPEFDGRFFVKIIEDESIKKHLSANPAPDDLGFKVDASINRLFYIADEDNALIASGDGTTTNDNSTTRADWEENFGYSTAGRWFIDAASFAGLQPPGSNHPKESITIQDSDSCSDVSSNYFYSTYAANIAATTTTGETNPYNIPFVGNINGDWPGDSFKKLEFAPWANTTSPPSSPPSGFHINIKRPVKNLTPGYPSALNDWSYTITTGGFSSTVTTVDVINDYFLFPIQPGSVSGSALLGSTTIGYLPQDPVSGIWTNLHNSTIELEEKALGDKQSTGLTFLKGVHTANYTGDIDDLETDGGYTTAGTQYNYLHLSYGNIGPVENNTITSNFLEHQLEFYDDYNWNKNWNVGEDDDNIWAGSNDINPSTTAERVVVGKLKANSLFRLPGDDDIYKIYSVTKRRLYNYQGAYNDAYDWYQEFDILMLGGGVFNKVNGNQGDPINTANNILPQNVAAALMTANGPADGFADTRTVAQHRRMIDPTNCRLSYLIRYEVLPLAENPESSGNTSISNNTQFTSLNDVTDFVRMEFVSPYNSTPENLLPSDPAIFETEPKEDLGLDIYYEATGKIPTNTSTKSSKIQNLIHIGALLSISPAKTAVDNGNGAFVNEVYWDDSEGSWYAQVSAPITIDNLNGDDVVIKFHNDDGTYSTAFWDNDYTGSSPNTDTTDLLKLIISPSSIGLGWFNCWSFGNGVESNRIGDTFNKPFITNGVKASTTLLESYKEEHRKYGLIYSGIYNSTSGVNDLNQFIAAEKITKDINPTYGSIQKLHSRSTADGDLITLCEDRCLRILANKDALFNADGNSQLLSTNNVLGKAIPFSGEFGISQNPESFASASYRVYFTDKIRGAVMRLSRDGLTAISDNGMKDWFKDNLKLKNKIIGSHDDKKNEYNVTLFPIVSSQNVQVLINHDSQ